MSIGTLDNFASGLPMVGLTGEMRWIRSNEWQRRSPPNRRWTILSKRIYAGHEAAIAVVHDNWLPRRSIRPSRNIGLATNSLSMIVEGDTLGDRIGLERLATADLADEGDVKIVALR